MPRRPREDTAGSIHHITNRGLSRRSLFNDVDDRRYFLSLVARAVRSGSIQVYAFCLMENHFHLLVKSRTGALAGAMQRIQSGHTRRFNRKTGRDGTLFKGRYSSRIITDSRYWNIVLDYIEANPVDAGVVGHKSEAAFSSARFRQAERPPPWLSLGTQSPTAVRQAHSTHTGEDLSWIVRRSGFHSGQAPVRWPDSLDPPKILAWLEERALHADGRADLPPAASPTAIRNALKELRRERGEWVERLTTRDLDGYPILEVGLLQELCGMGVGEIGRLRDMSPGSIHSQLGQHTRLMRHSRTYAGRHLEAIPRILRGLLGPSAFEGTSSGDL